MRVVARVLVDAERVEVEVAPMEAALAEELAALL